MDAQLKDNLERLRKHSEINGYYSGLTSLLILDAWTAIPPKGRPYRGKMSGFFAGEQLRHQTANEAKELIACLEGVNLEDDIQRSMLRELKREYAYNTAIPPEKMAALTELASNAQAVWKEAHENSDFNLFKPYLKKIFDLNRELADLIGLDGHPLNSLAARYEPDIDVEKVAVLFTDLKTGIIDLLGKITTRAVDIDDSAFHQDFDETQVFEFTKHVVETMGYDSQAGGYGEVLHPFCAMIGPNDARITSNYSNFKFGVFAGIHEAGHGMYGQNSHTSLADTGLWGGISGAVHESQSRFYENILGKSRAFWTGFFPELKRRFAQFADVDLDQFYRALNRVEPSLQRITSDEVTYSLHPIIRFEIEKEVLEDKISVDELQDVWNAKYKAFLGVEPPNDREGVLQDVHWSMGLLGYFQSYSLGNLYGGQLLAQLKKDVPTAVAEIAAGNFTPVNTWLKENVHGPSRVLTPGTLVKKVTGKELSAQFFVDYLNEKYSKIYGF